MVRTILFLVAALLAGLAYIALSDYDHRNDLIFYNGNILTMRDSSDRPEAVYVRNGIIEAVGSKDEVLQRRTRKTELIDLKGKTLMPGFFDAHGHFDFAAVFYSMTDISGVTYRRPEEVWARVEAAARNAGAGEWVFCYGMDPILTKGIQSPTLAYMDSIAPDKPLVIITKALHVFYANSRAFEALGITEKTPDPSAASYYEKDDNGKLTGAIFEQEALEPFRLKIQEQVTADYVKNTEGVMQEYARLGVTSAVNMGLGISKKSILSLYEHLAAGKSRPLYKLLEFAGKLPERKPNPRIFLYLRKENADILPEKSKQQDDFFRIVGVKFWYDGSPYAGSMFLKKPYIRSGFTINGINLSPTHTGESLMREDELRDWIARIQDKGYPVAVHAQGDLANEQTISAFRQLHEKESLRAFRHRLEHCMLLPQGSIPALKEMNLSPSYHINHLLYYGAFLDEEVIGAERAALLFPIQSTVKAQIPYSLHADMPMFAADPLSLASTSVNRRTESGTVYNAAECVSVWQALKSITLDAAWQLHMDDKLGSIEPGKYADLVILDKNPLQIRPQDLATIRVLETRVAGRKIY